MFDQAISSLKFNIKERVTNPLIGTMITVWTFHNWDIVYTFFNFDKSQTLDDKLERFHNYWHDHWFWGNMGVVLLYSFAILIVMYLLLSLSALLQTIYDRTLLPKAKHIWKGDKVQFKELISMEKNRDFYQDKYEKARSVKNALVIERDEFQQKYDDAFQKSLMAQENERSLNKDLENAQSSIKNYKNEIHNITETLNKINGQLKDIKYRKDLNLDFKFQIPKDRARKLSSNLYQSILDALNREFKPTDVENVLRNVVNHNHLNIQSSTIHAIAITLIKFGVLYSDELHLSDNVFKNYPLTFTDLGKEFYNKFSDQFQFG